jgi:tetratricopeptide (TPR) repeat protein
MRILEAAGAGLDHPAFDGVPRTAGRSPDSGGDDEALKLLMFIDGSSSLRDLAEVLTVDADALVRHIVALFVGGVIVFDDEYVAQWLTEDEPGRAEAEAGRAEAEAGRAEAEAGRAEAEEKLRVIGEAIGAATPDPAPEVEALSEEVPEEPEELPGEIVEEGRLDETPAWQVLTRIARTDFQGWVRLSSSAGRRDILLRGGRPVYCTSDLPDEDMAHLLRMKEAIEEDAYSRYGEAGDGDVEPSRRLVRLGVLPEYNRLRAVRWRAQTILFNLLELDTGTFLVEKLQRLPRRTPRFDLNFNRILTRFLDEKLPVDAEVEKLQEKMEYYIVPTEGAGEQSFQDKEQRLWEVIQERPRKLKSLFSLSTMFRMETYKFILLLLVNGLAELTKSVSFEEGPLDLRIVEDLADDLEDQNYFDVLGVHAVSDQIDVEGGYRRLAKKFDASDLKGLDDETSKALTRCRARVDEAFKALREEGDRNSYRRETFTAYQLAQFAQLQYQKGEIYLWWRQSPKEAFPFFRSAMELDPAQPLYWAAYAIGALSGGSSEPRVRQQSAKLAERVAGMANVDPTALVMAGGALIKMGQAGRGEECLKKATAMSPGNAAVSKMIKSVLAGGDAA